MLAADRPEGSTGTPVAARPRFSRRKTALTQRVPQPLWQGRKQQLAGNTNQASVDSKEDVGGQQDEDPDVGKPLATQSPASSNEHPPSRQAQAS